jgi:hypothetical protein
MMPTPSRKLKVVINRRLAKGITKEVARGGIGYAAVQAENELIDILSPPPKRTGRIYPRGKKQHQASAPGESPAVDTGQLRQSVVSYTEEFGDTIRAVVGTPLKYGAILQYGTERIKPRPWISRLNEAERWSRILRAFRIGVQRQYKRARSGFSA